ncbi:MAG: hypothetical protein IKR84_04695 [Oscillibacter sp.]|nr:hypothetical protein [Oscillibacter sp.]
MKEKFKRLFALMMTLAIVMSMAAPIASAATTAKKNSAPTTKISKFIKDNRWKNGISWGYYQRPKTSTYGSIGCCAYAADFVKYVYGSNNLRSGSKYTKASAIKTGDVLYGTPQHWMCVVSRSGSTLKIAQGNCSSKVRIATYTLDGNKIKTSNGSVFKTFSYGYHYY